MQNETLIGIGLGKYSFHIHCQDKSDRALFRKKLSRAKLTFTTVLMEACIGAHFMARRIADLGYETKLILTIRSAFLLRATKKFC